MNQLLMILTTVITHFLGRGRHLAFAYFILPNYKNSWLKIKYVLRCNKAG